MWKGGFGQANYGVSRYPVCAAVHIACSHFELLLQLQKCFLCEGVSDASCIQSSVCTKSPSQICLDTNSKPSSHKQSCTGIHIANMLCSTPINSALHYTLFEDIRHATQNMVRNQQFGMRCSLQWVRKIAANPHEYLQRLYAST